MTRTKTGPLAEKLLRAAAKTRNQKVVELAAFAAGRQHAAELQKTIATPERMADLHPAHSVYVYVQNQVSVMSETITQLPMLDKLTAVVGKAEDAYMPSGPPMSPLTGSYFFCWAVFDAAKGRAKETIGTCILAVARWAGADPELIRIMEIMQDSRMGLYIHEGSEGDIVHLRELVTGERLPCLSPSGYRGKRDEIWLARVLPPPAPVFQESVVFTTPYVITDPGEREWQAYLEHTLPKARGRDTRERYAYLMKYGLELNYWNEYIFEAYANHQTSVVFLRGLPDIEESRPHSRKSEQMYDTAIAAVRGCRSRRR